MSRPKWSRYFRYSLLIHGIVFALLGGAAFYHLQAAGPAPIKVQVVMSGTGNSGGKQAGSGKPAPAITKPVTSPTTTAASEEASAEAKTSPQTVISQPASPAQAPVSDSGEQAVQSTVSRDNGTITGSSEETMSSANGGNGKPGNSDAPGDGGGFGNGDANGGNSGGDGNGDDGPGTEDLSEPATLTRYAKLYPRAARNAGEEGTVVVGVTVGPDGHVTEAYLEQSSGIARLDNAAVKSAYNWRFSPAKNTAGQPIAGSAQIRVTYSLQD